MKPYGNSEFGIRKAEGGIRNSEGGRPGQARHSHFPQRRIPNPTRRPGIPTSHFPLGSSKVKLTGYGIGIFLVVLNNMVQRFGKLTEVFVQNDDLLLLEFTFFFLTFSAFRDAQIRIPFFRLLEIKKVGAEDALDRFSVQIFFFHDMEG